MTDLNEVVFDFYDRLKSIKQVDMQVLIMRLHI